MARNRSPNYPTIGLMAAIEKARAIQKAEGKNSVSREALAKVLGYTTLNGGSATMLSALGKYGLIESTKDGEAKLSDLSMRILYPEDGEREAALLEAGFKPPIFAELREKWPEQTPSDEAMRSYLIRGGFTETAVEQVIQFYREIIDIAKPPMAAQSPLSVKRHEEGQMSSIAQRERIVTQPPLPLVPQPPKRAFSLSLDGGVITGTLALKSVRDIERLIKVLDAQKAALEAMQEDEDEQDKPDIEGL